MKKGKISSVASANCMKAANMPEKFSNMNTLEQHLITPVLQFMKIISLRHGAQPEIHGPIVCVPADIDTTCKSLPRASDDLFAVRVKLKRKIEYKGHHLYQEVRPEIVRSGLLHLKECHPSFVNIDVADVSLTSMDGIFDDTNNDTPLSSNATGEQDMENQNGDSDDVIESSAPMVTCLQPSDMSQHVSDNYEDLVFNVAPGEGHTPISIFGKEADAFPFLFPNGQNTYTHKRDMKIGFSMYVKARLFSADVRFAQNAQYIFYLQYHKEVKDILQSASVSMRKGKAHTVDGSSITASTVCNVDSFQNLSRKNEGYKYLQAVRGSAPYWERTMRDLCAMVRQLGIPTWFASFSAADKRWPEIIKSICGQMDQQVPENMDWAAHCSLVNSNPVTAVRMFEQRVKNFIKIMIKSPSNVIGKVSDIFVRVEFQQRGWPHIHCLFWVENAPKLDKETDTQITDFIDKYITTSHISEAEEENLHKIISDVQLHSRKHTQSCKKGGKTCRFRFPRPPSCWTFVCRPTPCPLNTDEMEWKKTSEDQLKKVWEQLEQEQVPQTTEELFENAKITQRK